MVKNGQSHRRKDCQSYFSYPNLLQDTEKFLVIVRHFESFISLPEKIVFKNMALV